MNAEGEFDLLFSSLFEGLDSGILREVVVADAGSSHATVIIAEKVGCLVAKGGGENFERISLANGIFCLSLIPKVFLRQNGARKSANMSSNSLKHGIFFEI